jgi:aspartate/methionine/tyrosine aminotransferase
VQGVCEKVAEAFENTHGVKVDPKTQVTICCGQSEAMAASVFAGLLASTLPQIRNV